MTDSNGNGKHTEKTVDEMNAEIEQLQAQISGKVAQVKRCASETLDEAEDLARSAESVKSQDLTGKFQALRSSNKSIRPATPNPK